MNYLAHVFLSNQSPEAIAGAFLGDFVKGAIGTDHAPLVREAILLHRAIDKFTDAHALTLASCAIISPARRRFAPVLVDVFYDHFLARHWRDYSDVPLANFTQRIYGALLAQRMTLPPRLQWVAVRMAADDWLGAYGTQSGVAAALGGIARRLARYRRAVALLGAIDELENNYAALERNFSDFFPQLQEYVAAHGGERHAA
jgi:acyl carrier protein phosphodiesterase